jgi:hypothetical protein
MVSLFSFFFKFQYNSQSPQVPTPNTGGSANWAPWTTPRRREPRRLAPHPEDELGLLVAGTPPPCKHPQRRREGGAVRGRGPRPSRHAPAPSHGARHGATGSVHPFVRSGALLPHHLEERRPLPHPKSSPTRHPRRRRRIPPCGPTTTTHLIRLSGSAPPRSAAHSCTAARPTSPKTAPLHPETT